jgi:hypothetical protein
MMIMWSSVRFGKILERIQEPQPQRFELKQHKPCFKEGCLKLLDQRK